MCWTRFFVRVGLLLDPFVFGPFFSGSFFVWARVVLDPGFFGPGYLGPDTVASFASRKLAWPWMHVQQDADGSRHTNVVWDEIRNTVPILISSKENQKQFTLKPAMKFGYIPREDQGEKTSNNLASFIGKEHWATSRMRIYWHCTWSAKGLSPQKPAVHLKTSMVLPPGRAWLISG